MCVIREGMVYGCNKRRDGVCVCVAREGVVYLCVTKESDGICVGKKGRDGASLCNNGDRLLANTIFYDYLK